MSEEKSADKAVIIGVVLGVGCIGLVICGGMLAVIAIPNFIAMQLRAKRAELPSYVDGIRTAEKAYHAEWDSFTSVGPCPPYEVPLGREPIVWESSWDCFEGFRNLGWLPDGPAYGRYQVTAAPGSNSSSNDFQVSGEADVDGNFEPARYEANRAERAMMVSPNNAY